MLYLPLLLFHRRQRRLLSAWSKGCNRKAECLQQRKKESNMAESEVVKQAVTQTARKAAKAMMVAMKEFSEEGRRYVTAAG